MAWLQRVFVMLSINGSWLDGPSLGACLAPLASTPHEQTHNVWQKHSDGLILLQQAFGRVFEIGFGLAYSFVARL